MNLLLTTLFPSKKKNPSHFYHPSITNRHVLEYMMVEIRKFRIYTGLTTILILPTLHSEDNNV